MDPKRNTEYKLEEWVPPSKKLALQISEGIQGNK